MPRPTRITKEKIITDYIDIFKEEGIRHMEHYTDEAYDVTMKIIESKYDTQVAIQEISRLKDNIISMRTVFYVLLMLSPNHNALSKILSFDALWDGIGEWEA